MGNENFQALSMDQLDTVTGGGMDGISYLIAVTQMKANNANDAAMAGSHFRSTYSGSPTARLWR